MANTVADKRHPSLPAEVFTKAGTRMPNNIKNFLFIENIYLLNKLEQVTLHGTIKPIITQMPNAPALNRCQVEAGKRRLLD